MRILLAVACSFAIACGSSPAGPSQQGPLVLSTSISRTPVPAGDTATLTFTLQNLGSHTETLHFSDGCQVLPFIKDDADKIVYPDGGGWVCTLALSQLTLSPGEVKTVQMQVGSGARAPYPYARLGAGDYSAYAKVPSGEYKLQSESVRFTVQ